MNGLRVFLLPALAAIMMATFGLAVPASAAPSCFGRTATIVGTNRDPAEPVELNGTASDDVIVGRRGWDIIEGRGGRDLICSGRGDDYVVAGAGNDRVKGGDDLDTLIGGAGDDRLWGGRGHDSLAGRAGNDDLFGGRGSLDSLVGGRGNDVMAGGRGYDLAEFWDSRNGVEVNLMTDVAVGHGDDRVVSIEGVVGSNYDDIIYGDDLSNMIQGGGGNDEIHALGSHADGGSDLLRSGGGEDVLDGGEGPDIVSYNLSPIVVNANLTDGVATVPGFGFDTFQGIENLVGSKYDDTLIGDDADNLILGNRGNDTMDGRGGIDEAAFFDSGAPVAVDLGAGAADGDWWGSDSLINFENITGSAWADDLVGDDGANVIQGGSRADSIHGLGGDDVLVGEPGRDEADGGDGNDECDAESETNCELDPAFKRLEKEWWMAAS
jgi:Ca2+-binding RTX toxin-like protein